MERSRESKRAGSGPRRLRISCPKDLTDAEARMDDTPLIEKVKKGNLQALCASSPSTASKRRRYGFQEAHNLSEGFNCTKHFSKLTPSDDDACQGTLHSKQRAKKDELVINICNIPRRARSSATRVPFASSRLLVPTSQQRSPSTGILFRREEKIVRQIGVKSRLLKDLEVMKSEQISDQEAEIAGLLYDLSRSLPTFAQSTSAKSEEKSCRDLEEEVFNSSSSPIADLEKLSRSCGPLLTEQKRKRLRVFDKQEESPCMQPAERVSANTGFCVGELPVLVEQGIQVDESLYRNGAASKLSYHQPELMTRNVIKEFCFEDDKNASYTEEEIGQEQKVSEDNQTHSAGQTCKQDSLESSSPSTNKSELCGQGFCKDSNGLKNSSRSHKGLEGSGTSVSKDMWRISKNCNGNNEKVNQENGVQTPIKDDHRLGTMDVPRWNQGLLKAPLSPKKGEQEVLRLLRVKNQNILMPDLCKNEETLSGVSLLSTVHPSSNSVLTSNGRIGAVPQLGLNRKAGPSWLTNCLHSGSSSCQTVEARI
ncbi:hypothetical protein L7F22_041496 [Adiantum nelumboides]|nr:hypothetical protein [Adiantum nelumboides]